MVKKFYSSFEFYFIVGFWRKKVLCNYFCLSFSSVTEQNFSITLAVVITGDKQWYVISITYSLFKDTYKPGYHNITFFTIFSIVGKIFLIITYFLLFVNVFIIFVEIDNLHFDASVPCRLWTYILQNPPISLRPWQAEVRPRI